MARIAAHPWRTIGTGVAIHLGWLVVLEALYDDTPGRDAAGRLALAYAPVAAGSGLIVAGGLAGAVRAAGSRRTALWLAALAGVLQCVTLGWDTVNELRGSESSTYILPWMVAMLLLPAAGALAMAGRRFARRPEAVREPLRRRFGRGVREGAKSWTILAGNRDLLVLPATSFLTGAGAWAGGYVLAGEFAGAPEGRAVLASLAVLLPATFVGSFCGVAYLAALDRRLSGERAGVRDGLRVAWRRRRAILGWSLLAAGVGALIQAAQQLRGGWAAAPLVSWLAGAAWAVLTLFVLPVLALEDRDVRGSVRRSAGLVRRRWGESAGGVGSIWLVGFAAIVAVSVAMGIGAGLAGPGIAGDAVLVAGCGLGALLLVLAGLATEILALALYRHAAGRGATAPFTPDDLDGAIIPRRRW